MKSKLLIAIAALAVGLFGYFVFPTPYEWVEGNDGAHQVNRWTGESRGGGTVEQAMKAAGFD